MLTHGTLERYHRGCGCSACVLAMARADQDRPRRTRHPRNGISPGLVRSDRLCTGELAVECWCQQAVVYVEPAVVRACATDSCGGPGCGP